MTWHKVDVYANGPTMVHLNVRAKHLADLTKWCEIKLSSNGVLWKRDFGSSYFYFAQEQDAVLFKLTHGV